MVYSSASQILCRHTLVCRDESDHPQRDSVAKYQNHDRSVDS